MKAWSMVLGIGACVLVVGCDKAKDLVRSALKNAEVESADPAATGEVKELRSAEYDAFESQPRRLVVVDFHADWCGPCRKLAPMMEKMAAEFAGKAVVGKVNIDKEGGLARKRGVEGIPDVRFFLDGKQVDRIVGLPPEAELREKFTKHTAKVKAVSMADGEAPAKEPEVKPLSEGWLPPGMEKATKKPSPLGQ